MLSLGIANPAYLPTLALFNAQELLFVRDFFWLNCLALHFDVLTYTKVSVVISSECTYACIRVTLWTRCAVASHLLHCFRLWLVGKVNYCTLRRYKICWVSFDLNLYIQHGRDPSTKITSFHYVLLIHEIPVWYIKLDLVTVCHRESGYGLSNDTEYTIADNLAPSWRVEIINKRANSISLLLMMKLLWILSDQQFPVAKLAVHLFGRQTWNKLSKLMHIDTFFIDFSASPWLLQTL